MMDRKQYSTAVDDKIGKIGEAYMEYYGAITKAAASVLVEASKPMWRQKFMNFAGSDSADARQAKLTLDTGIGHIQNIAANENGTPLESIRNDTTQWIGEAKTSFDGYLNDVENALQHQWDCAQTLTGMLHIQGGLIDAGHEYALSIADQTVASLKKVAVEEERRERQMLAEIVTGVVGGVGIAISGGGATGAVAGAITGISQVANAVVKGTTGDDPDTVIDWMFGEIDKAEGAMDDDRRQFAEALGACSKTYFGEATIQNLLPPKIDLTAAAM